MRITLNIERVVLEGIQVTPAQRCTLGAAFETELARLITERFTEAPSGTGFSTPMLPALSVQLATPLDPAAAGAEIARAVYRGIDSGGTPGEEEWG